MWVLVIKPYGAMRVGVHRFIEAGAVVTAKLQAGVSAIRATAMGDV
jgi:hypothetical protein